MVPLIARCTPGPARSTPAGARSIGARPGPLPKVCGPV
jgi:hypothetical protein